MHGALFLVYSVLLFTAMQALPLGQSRLNAFTVDVIGKNPHVHIHTHYINIRSAKTCLVLPPCFKPRVHSPSPRYIPPPPPHPRGYVKSDTCRRAHGLRKKSGGGEGREWGLILDGKRAL